jgi:hypothetical protein
MEGEPITESFGLNSEYCRTTPYGDMENGAVDRLR